MKFLLQIKEPLLICLDNWLGALLDNQDIVAICGLTVVVNWFYGAGTRMYKDVFFWVASAYFGKSLDWTVFGNMFLLLLHRPRFSTSSKFSNPMLPSWDLLWWTQPSTCFSLKWRANWNRLKTNWNKPKMNWVPGNLHLIGKQTKYSPVKTFLTLPQQECYGGMAKMLYSQQDSNF